MTTEQDQPETKVKSLYHYEPKGKTFNMNVQSNLINDLHRLVYGVFNDRQLVYGYLAQDNRPPDDDQFMYYVLMLMSMIRKKIGFPNDKWSELFNEFFEKKIKVLNRPHVDKVPGENEMTVEKNSEAILKSEGIEVTLTNKSKISIEKEKHDLICATAASNGIPLTELTGDDFLVMSDAWDQQSGKAGFIKVIENHIQKISSRINQIHNITDDESFSMTCAEGLLLSNEGDIQKINDIIKAASEKYNFIHVREKA